MERRWTAPIESIAARAGITARELLEGEYVRLKSLRIVVRDPPGRILQKLKQLNLVAGRRNYRTHACDGKTPKWSLRTIKEYIRNPSNVEFKRSSNFERCDPGEAGLSKMQAIGILGELRQSNYVGTWTIDGNPADEYEIFADIPQIGRELLYIKFYLDHSNRGVVVISFHKSDY